MAYLERAALAHRAAHDTNDNPQVVLAQEEPKALGRAYDRADISHVSQGPELTVANQALEKVFDVQDGGHFERQRDQGLVDFRRRRPGGLVPRPEMEQLELGNGFAEQGLTLAEQIEIRQVQGAAIAGVEKSPQGTTQLNQRHEGVAVDPFVRTPGS